MLRHDVSAETGDRGYDHHEDGRGYVWCVLCGVHCGSQHGGDLRNMFFSFLALAMARRTKDRQWVECS